MIKQSELKLFYFLYIILILLIISIIAKFIVDFYSLNKKVDAPIQKKVELSKFVLKPRVQTYENHFEYIEADRGYLNNDDYIFENVKTHGYFGVIKSGKLEVKDKKNIFIFTENPNFTIYLDNIKEDDKNV